MRRVLLFTLLYLFCYGQLKAQESYRVDIIQLASGEEYIWETMQAASSILFSPIGEEAVDVKFKSAGHQFFLSLYPSSEKEEMPSGFVILPRPNKKFSLYSERSVRLKVEYFYAQEIPQLPHSLKYKKSDCEKPSTIDQSIWRSGLNDPDTPRTETSVKHLIIHHSAGNNANTNFTSVVRNIYLLHTQSNGWDDIGYNYLIAPDGTVYDGRDAMGAGDEDNIQGAHFCAKNSGTMGLCLLGNYNDTSISVLMYESIIELLTWKLFKEKLFADDSFPHPNSNSNFLGAIARHRDGCATTCPGDSIALIIDQIRYDVAQELNTCYLSASVFQPQQVKAAIQVFPNPSLGAVQLKGIKDHHSGYYRIIDSRGKEIRNEIISGLPKETLYLDPGIYYLLLFIENESPRYLKIIIIK